MKKIIKIIKKIVLGFIILYGYNVIAIKFNSLIPINICTLSSISLLGMPALFALIFIQKIVY